MPSRAILVARSQSDAYATLKQAWHWYDKRFTPWHAIWRENSWQCAWGCGCGENFEMFEKFFQGVTTCHDDIVAPFSCHFVNYEQTRRTSACRNVNILKFSPRLGPHYPHLHAPPRLLARFLPPLVHQIACHGVKRLSWQCDACLSVCFWQGTCIKTISSLITRLTIEALLLVYWSPNSITATCYTDLWPMPRVSYRYGIWTVSTCRDVSLC